MDSFSTGGQDRPNQGAEDGDRRSNVPHYNQRREIIDTVIQLLVIALLLYACFEIVSPFLATILWAIVIAIGAHPIYSVTCQWLGGRSKLAAFFFVMASLAVIVGPVLILSWVLVENAEALAIDLSDGKIAIPPPPTSMADWPVIGEPVYRIWSLASTNLQEALNELGPYLRGTSLWLLSNVTQAAIGVLQFILAIFVASALMASTASVQAVARAVTKRLAGPRGESILQIAVTTIRSVSRGVIGVALIQSLFAGLLYLVAGVPAAGFLAFGCLVLGVIQIGVLPITVPTAIWYVSVSDTFTGVVFIIFSILVSLTDNVLRPIVLGQGVKVPLWIVFVGAIGGLLWAGLVGLFLGAVLLALGYELLIAWLQDEIR